MKRQPKSSQDFSSPMSAQPPIFQFYLLGELNITLNWQQSLSPLPYRAYSLLAALLLHPQSLRREYLSAQLFPELSARDGRRRLSDVLWLLRKALPGLPLDATAHELWLSPECRWLDVEAFYAAANTDDVEQWFQALALYRGDLLASVYVDWLLEKREHA